MIGASGVGLSDLLVTAGIVMGEIVVPEVSR